MDFKTCSKNKYLIGFKASMKSFRISRISGWYYFESNLQRRKTEDKHFKKLKEEIHSCNSVYSHAIMHMSIHSKSVTNTQILRNGNASQTIHEKSIMGQLSSKRQCLGKLVKTDYLFTSPTFYSLISITIKDLNLEWISNT